MNPSPRSPELCRVHKVELIAIGNGTASRETDKLAAELVSKHPDLKLTKIMVSEAGASVYSASAFASQELPDLDVSIARRRLHRAPPAGSAGRTGEDRSEIHRRRPVPARSCRAQALPLPRRGGGGLRERGRRRSQHRLGAAARARVRPRRLGGAEHRDPPRRQRPVQDAQGADQGLGPRAQRPSSRRRASCASRTATIRSMPPACTRKPIRWCAAFSRPRRATSRW